MASQLDDMDIGSVMPMLRTQQQANSPGGAVARSDDINGTKEGHWSSENSYDIPGGKVDTKQESTVQSGQGWHTQATKQTSVMQQEFAGADIKPNQGAVLRSNSQQSGAMKLLSELDNLTGKLGQDLSESDVTQSVKTTTTQSKTIKLSKVSSPFHGQPFETAVKGNYVNTSNGEYTDFSGKTHTLSDAFEKDLINPDSAVFINPANGQSMTLHNAIQRGLVKPTGHYTDPDTGSRCNLGECMAKSLVITREVEPITVDTEKKEEHFKFHVDKVVDPSTGELISVDAAIQKGIFDPAKGKYFNIKTGELLSIQEAVARNLMVTSSKGPNTARTSSSQLIKTSKSFNVVGAIHPVLKKRMSLNEAISEGILDRSKGLYLDTLNNKKYKIQDAIQRGLVVAEEVSLQKDEGVSNEIITNQESTFTVIGVLHPTTGEKLTVSKATDLGILDTAQGSYINIDTGASISMNEAIEKGLVLVERGMMKRDERDRKVSSLHIDEEEEEVWTVVEEVKTETKKWVITSVVDPRTSQKISFDDALLERILDQENGKYCNPESGAEMSIGQAIEKNLIQGELVSVNLDEEEYSSFQASADNVEHVRDPRTHKIITYDAACKLGLINKDAKTFHNPITDQQMSFQEASEKGFIKRRTPVKSTGKSMEREIKPKAANAVEAHKEKFHTKRNVFEEAMQRGGSSDYHSHSGGGMFDESFRVEETKTMETDYVDSGWPSRPVVPDRPLVNDSRLLSRVDEVLDRAKLYTNESVISSTETHMSGYTTDWQNERVYNLRTGEELSLEEGVEKGILDAKQVKLMRDYKKSRNPSKLSTETFSASQTTTSQAGTGNKMASYGSPNGHHSGEDMIRPAHNAHTQFSVNSSGSRGSSVNRDNTARSSSATRENTSMIVQVSQTQQSQSRIGPLSYMNAVKLGLFNIKTGKYRDPVSGLTLGIQDAVSRGFIQANGDALTNLNTGTPISLADSIQRNLIDSDTGKIFESKLKQLNIAVPNQFMSSRSARNAPINFEDALKVGLLNPYTGEFQHPQSDETSTLGDAVTQQYIAGKSVILQDPTSGMRYYLDDALKKRIINPSNGDIMDANKREKVMSLYEALKTKLFESVYDPFDSSLLDPNNGSRIDVNQAVKRSQLGHNTCLVYDTVKNRQVPFDEAVDDDIVDRQMAMYNDKKGGRRLVCKTAAEMGLIEPIGAPVLNKMRVLESISKLYGHAGDSISAPSYTMYEDVKSTALSTVQKPDIRTEVDTQEYKSERTIKLSGKGDKPRGDMIEIAPGDKVLTPRPFKPGRSAPPPQETMPYQQSPVQHKPPRHSPKPSPSYHSPNYNSPSYSPQQQPNGLPIVEEQITPIHAWNTGGLDYDTAKEPVQKGRAPKHQAPMTSPGNSKIISVTEEVVETVETKPGSKRTRHHIDDISAPEYFTKGESVEITVEDHDDIDDYRVQLKTDRPQDIDWDLNLVQKPGKEQKVTKVVEEVVEELVDNQNQQQQRNPNQMQITVDSTETHQKSPSPPPVIDEPIEPVRNVPVRKAPKPEPEPVREPQPEPQRIRDKEIIIIEREGGTVTKNVTINIDTALEEGYVDLAKREFTHPATGEVMSLVEAIRRGYILGSNDEIRDAITKHYEKLKLASIKKAVMEYSTTKEFSSFMEKEQQGMPLAEAISEKHFDPRSGKFVEPKSGLTYTLREAVDHGMIDGDSAQFTNPGNKKTTTIKDALDKKMLDSYGKWTSPLTGQKSPFSDAIKKGHVQMISSEQTINKITTITEVKKVRVDFVVHPVTMEKVDYNQAVMEGIISTVDGIYRNPATGDTLSLDEAVKHGLISGEILDTKRKSEEKILDSTNIVARSMDEPVTTDGKQSHESSLHIIRSPMKSYVIDTVVDPRTQKFISAGEAIKMGIIDPSTATYHNIVTGESITFEEAIRRQLLRCMETTDLPESEKFNILGVICPRTGQEISMSQALDDGVLDFKRGVYMNTVTGRTVSFADAIEKNLIRCEGTLPEGMTSVTRNELEEDVTNAVYTEQKSFTITGAKDTTTGENVSIKEAIRRGILDADLSTYRCLKTRKSYTIQEAIDEGLLVATIDDPNAPKTEKSDTSMTVNTTKTFDIEAVIDPKTKEEIPAKEAVQRGIIDEATDGTLRYTQPHIVVTGDYVNVDTMESWSMDHAIKEGLVKAKPIPANDTVSFSISAVVDPKTGEQMTVSDALRHGFLDRGRKHFCNAHTGETCKLDEALRNGWIVIKSNYDRSKGKSGLSFRDHASRPAPSTMGPSGFQTFTILSVLDAKTGEDLPVVEAVRRGILDESKRNYKDTLTGETMILDTAVKRNFIKLGPSSVGVTKTSFSEALRRGYINTQTGKYACPSTGQIMSVDEAVRRGLLVDETGHRLGGEDMTIKPTQVNSNRQSRSFENALKHGMIDSRSGKFLNPDSGEAMTLGRAVHQGHLGPNTQWKAYSYKSSQQQQQQQAPPPPQHQAPPPPQHQAPPTHHQMAPPSPGSVHSSVSYRNVDPIYSTIHKSQTMSSGASPRDMGPMNIHAAKDRGLLNTRTGEVAIPQYGGTSMLIDDALLQGFIVTSLPMNVILSRPASPHSYSVSQAFQQGMIFPANLTVRKHSGQFISFEDALDSGLLYPRASSTMRREGSMAREGSVAREPVNNTMRAASLPPGSGQNQNYSYSSYRKQASSRRGAPPMAHQADRSATMNGHMSNGTMNGSTRMMPDVMTNNFRHQSTGTMPHSRTAAAGNGHQQQQRMWEKSSHHQSTTNNQHGGEQSPGFYPDYPAQSNSPLLNGNAHFVNGKLFASRPGYKIEGNGNVVNMSNGETLTLGQAQKMHIVQQIPDDEYDAGTLPPNFSMFNRKSQNSTQQPFPPKSQRGSAKRHSKTRKQYSTPNTAV